jgi:hypothetical protein
MVPTWIMLPGWIYLKSSILFFFIDYGNVNWTENWGLSKKLFTFGCAFEVFDTLFDEASVGNLGMY